MTMAAFLASNWLRGVLMKSQTQKRRSRKGRGGGRFLSLPKEWTDSSQWAALSATDLKLLIDLATQYNGSNNGDLCATWSVMKKRGWRSPGTVSKAIHSLIEKQWLLLTRQGGRHAPSLFALTFWGIDACGGKLDVPANPVPMHSWKNAIRSHEAYQCSHDTYQFTSKTDRKAA